MPRSLAFELSLNCSPLSYKQELQAMGVKMACFLVLCHFPIFHIRTKGEVGAVIYV